MYEFQCHNCQLKTGTWGCMSLLGDGKVFSRLSVRTVGIGRPRGTEGAKVSDWDGWVATMPGSVCSQDRSSGIGRQLRLVGGRCCQSQSTELKEDQGGGEPAILHGDGVHLCLWLGIDSLVEYAAFKYRCSNRTPREYGMRFATARIAHSQAPRRI